VRRHVGGSSNWGVAIRRQQGITTEGFGVHIGFDPVATIRQGMWAPGENGAGCIRNSSNSSNSWAHEEGAQEKHALTAENSFWWG